MVAGLFNNSFQDSVVLSTGWQATSGPQFLYCLVTVDQVGVYLH